MTLIVIIMCIIAFGAGIWAWWMECGPEKKDKSENQKVNDNKE